MDAVTAQKLVITYTVEAHRTACISVEDAVAALRGIGRTGAADAITAGQYDEIQGSSIENRASRPLAALAYAITQEPARFGIAGGDLITHAVVTVLPESS
jgi:hypothetical protein